MDILRSGAGAQRVPAQPSAAASSTAKATGRSIRPAIDLDAAYRGLIATALPSLSAGAVREGARAYAAVTVRPEFTRAEQERPLADRGFWARARARPLAKNAGRNIACWNAFVLRESRENPQLKALTLQHGRTPGISVKELFQAIDGVATERGQGRPTGMWNPFAPRGISP